MAAVATIFNEEYIFITEVKILKAINDYNRTPHLQHPTSNVESLAQRGFLRRRPLSSFL